jgi:hypothetical protein
MMTTKNWMSALLIISVALTSSTAYADQNTKVTATGSAGADASFATQIAHAANLNSIRDVQLVAPSTVGNDPRSAASRTLDLAMAGGTASGIFSSGAVSPGMGASLWLISALLPSQEKARVDAYSRIFVWMPIEQAKGELEAVKLLKSTYFKAVQEALPGHDIEYVKPSSKNGGRGGISLKITGPKCPEGCIQPLFYIDEPEIAVAPDIIGGYTAYVWRIKEGKGKSNFIPQGKNFFPIGEQQLSREERVKFYQDLSAGLPQWAFLFIAPHDKASPVPVMFNSGIANYFIKPEKSPNLVSN